MPQKLVKIYLNFFSYLILITFSFIYRPNIIKTKFVFCSFLKFHPAFGQTFGNWNSSSSFSVSSTSKCSFIVRKEISSVFSSCVSVVPWINIQFLCEYCCWRSFLTALKNIFLFCTELYTLSTFSSEKVNGNTMRYVINMEFTFLLEN